MKDIDLFQARVAAVIPNRGLLGSQDRLSQRTVQSIDLNAISEGLHYTCHFISTGGENEHDREIIDNIGCILSLCAQIATNMDIPLSEVLHRYLHNNLASPKTVERGD